MTKYMLDTNIISTLGNEIDVGKVSDKLYSLSDDDNILVSIITLYEEKYGLKNCNDETRKLEIQKNIDFIQKFFEIIPLDLKEMDVYANLKVLYKNYTGINKKSMKKNDLDLLIASTAIAEDAVLVSDDSIFQVIADIEPGLKLENWLG